MIYENTREPACCFTGHRPQHLPWGFDESDPRCVNLKQRIYDTVRSVYDSGIRKFLCGMALGCDMYFAESVLELRSQFFGVTIEAAIPCEGQYRRWPTDAREKYFYLLHQFDRETVLSSRYTPDCMHRRNRYMVDNSDVLIAVWNGSSGGTAYTVKYAREIGRETILLMP